MSEVNVFEIDGRINASGAPAQQRLERGSSGARDCCRAFANHPDAGGKDRVAGSRDCSTARA